MRYSACDTVQLAMSLLIAAASVVAQDPQLPPKQAVVFGQPASLIANDRIEFAIAERGTSIVRLVLRGDPNGISPFGNPDQLSAAPPAPFEVLGHFLCVDGFGPPSPEESAAGLPKHGEAHTLPWKIVSAEKRGALAQIRFTVDLPLVHETVTRSASVVDGENVVYLDTEIKSHLGFDRTSHWGEHLTLGPPFLEPASLVIDMSGTRAKTRDYPAEQAGNPRRLMANREFIWPNAPLLAGGAVDMRPVPAHPNSADHTTTLMDPARKLAFVTALNTKRRYLVGIIFRRTEFPWVQTYEGYRSSPWLLRALEPATQPFDTPRRDAVTLNSMFDTPVYRWLPAYASISSRFALFYVRSPEGMKRVDEVRFENGRLIIEEHAGRRIALPASLGL